MKNKKAKIGFGLFLTGALAVGPALAPIAFVQPASATSVTDSATLTATRDGNQVSVSWDLVNNYENVELLRNGESLTTETGDGSYEDTLNPNTVVTYEISVSRELTDNEIDGLDSEEYKEIALSDPDALEHIQIQGVTLGLDQNSAFMSDPAGASASATSTTVRYQTFINSTYVSAPLTGCSYVQGGGYYFNGNGRSYSATSASYKTRADANIIWASKSISLSKSVGATNVYKLTSGTYKLVDTATASASGITLTISSISTTQAKFNMRHDVGNPFCSGNGIYYDLNLTVNRSGSYSVTGERLRVPHHEMYIKDSDTTTWKTILNEPIQSFDCLIPLISTGLGCLVSANYSGTRS